MGKHGIYGPSAYLGISPSKEDNAVLATAVNLDNGVAGGYVADVDVLHIHAQPSQFIDQPLTVWSNLAGVKDVRASAGKSGRLIRAFAAGKDLVGRTGDGLARSGDVFDLINEVDVERAKVEDVHPAVASR